MAGSFWFWAMDPDGSGVCGACDVGPSGAGVPTAAGGWARGVVDGEPAPTRAKMTAAEADRSATVSNTGVSGRKLRRRERRAPLSGQGSP
jgi:hypothetical protein